MSTLKSLRELVTFRGGGTPSKQVPEYWNGGIPWASVKDFTSTLLSETQDFISQEGLRNSSANLIPKGHVIIPTRMSLGKAAINTVDLAINQDLRALVPKVPLNTEFLLHAVLSLKDEIIKKGSGATVKGITQEELYKLEIALPPLNDQIRIAHLLGKVEGLIAQRKQHLQQLDDLLKSVFLEMFGDPVRNERGWDIHPLGSIGDVQGGLQVTTKRNDYEMDAPYLRVANVYRDRLNLSEIKRIGVTPAELNRVRLKTGDLLIVEGHGNPEEVGRSAVWDGSIENCVHQNHLIRVRVDLSQMTPLYASFFINSPGGRQQMFRSGKTTSGLNTISSKNVKETMVAVPPLGFQNEFGAIVEKVEALKSRYQQSLTDLESLYGALSQQAFKGELDLSRVPMPDTQAQEEKVVAAEPLHTPVEKGLAINLPDTGNLRAALESVETRKDLILQWLDAYRGQLHSKPFSVQHFITAVQTRLAELHADDDIDLGPNHYEHIKSWVCEALTVGTLTQALDDVGNRIELKAAQA
ncbi:MAG: restriction endonuclease subunit S [Candidatus Competibacteraceae bacterium]|nr:restriction endonuclease subunit S [Candidatus Competibacteraceae bacterium]